MRLRYIALNSLKHSLTRTNYAYIAELMGIDSGLHNFRSVCNMAEFQLVDMLSVVFLCGEKKTSIYIRLHVYKCEAHL